MREIINTANTIRIPVHLQETISKLYAIERKQGPQSVEDLAKLLELSERQVSRLLQVRDTMHVASLDTIVSTSDLGTPLLALIADDEALSPDKLYNVNELENGLIEAMRQVLTDKEEYIISRRFGLRTGESGTLEAIGAEVGVTRERIRQIQAKALKKLRTPRIKEYLKELLYKK